MTTLSQRMLSTFASELPRSHSPDDEGPLRLARSMVEWNNTEYGSALDYCATGFQCPDHRWIEIAWVFDKRHCMTQDGGDVVMCWWREIPCPCCEGYGYIEIFHHRTDALIGTRKCPETHPAPPPEPVSLTKPHHCTGDPLCCPPF